MTTLSAGNHPSRRVVLVTGASSGIGFEVARVFAERGFDVVVTARRAARLNELADEIRSVCRVHVTVAPEDLSDVGAPERLCVFLAEAGITVDALVNNAGFTERVKFGDRAWQAHIDQIHLMAVNPTKLIHLLLPGMVERRYGRIVNVLSLATYFPGSPYTTLYSPCKSYLHKLTEALAVEYADTGVHFTAAVPGMVDTELVDKMGVAAQVRAAPGFVVSPARLAAEHIYEASMAGRVVDIRRPFNKVVAAVMRHYPARRAHRLMDWDRGVLGRMGLGALGDPEAHQPTRDAIC